MTVRTDYWGIHRIKSALIALVLTVPSFAATAQNGPSLATTTEVYDGWTVACVTQENNKTCETRTGVYDDKGGLVIQISLSQKSQSNGNKNKRIQIAVPHLVNLKQPVKLSVDDKVVDTLHYAFCNANACYLNETVSNEILKSFRAGIEANLVISSLAVGTITAKIPLKGFTVSFERMLALSND